MASAQDAEAPADAPAVINGPTTLHDAQPDRATDSEVAIALEHRIKQVAEPEKKVEKWRRKYQEAREKNQELKDELRAKRDSGIASAESVTTASEQQDPQPELDDTSNAAPADLPDANSEEEEAARHSDASEMQILKEELTGVIDQQREEIETLKEELKVVKKAKDDVWFDKVLDATLSKNEIERLKREKTELEAREMRSSTKNRNAERRPWI